MSVFILLALAVLLQTAPVPTSNAAILVDGVARFSSASTNEQRFDTLTAMLTAKKLPFTVEPFSLERPLGREPRTEGRNVVVTLGDGSREFVAGGQRQPAAADTPDTVNGESMATVLRFAVSLIRTLGQR